MRGSIGITKLQNIMYNTYFPGGLLLLPVPTEATIAHVANTLPSAANLRIIVSSNMKHTVVAMDRVIKALKSLKQTHPEFKDVSASYKSNQLSVNNLVCRFIYGYEIFKFEGRN